MWLQLLEFHPIPMPNFWKKGGFHGLPIQILQ